MLKKYLLFPSFMLTIVSSTKAPLPPSQDPWYTAPPNFEQSTPGSILRIRQAPQMANSSQAYNILFRTTDAHYRPSWAVTTFYIPISASNTSSKGNALLSYQIPYNSADVDASPSYAVREASDISIALGRGWYVNFPDFEGPLAAFATGIQEGHAVLDSVRAVSSSGFGLSSDVKYAMWGYSGGSIASTWAAELQQQYAPELNFSGMAIGGLVPNFTTALHAVSGSFFAGLLPASLLGLTAEYPESRAYLISKLKTTGPHNATGFLQALKFDATTEIVMYQHQDIFDYFVNGEADLWDPLIQDILNANGYEGYHGIPQMPVFVYKAIHDELSPVEESDALVDKYCSVGVDILYQRNTIGSHYDEDFNGDERAFEWLASVLESPSGSDHPSRGCILQNVTVGAWNSSGVN